MTRPLRIALLAGVAAFGLATVAVAADTPTTSPSAAEAAGRSAATFRAPAAGGGGEARGSDMGHRGGDPERMARRLRDGLQLTPGQEPALQAFVAAMHPPHPPHPGQDRPGADHWGPGRRAEVDQRRADWDQQRAEEAALTTPQRLDLMLRRMNERIARRQAEMQAHVAAIKQFYAALTPSQQKAFDALHGGGLGRGRGGPRMGMEGPRPSLPPLAARAPLPQD